MTDTRAGMSAVDQFRAAVPDDRTWGRPQTLTVFERESGRQVAQVKAWTGWGVTRKEYGLYDEFDPDRYYWVNTWQPSDGVQLAYTLAGAVVGFVTFFLTLAVAGAVR